MWTKRTVAVLAVLGGAFQVANALRDVLAHEDGARDGAYVLAVALGVLMGALLAASGVALLRQRSGATRVARDAALASLALVVGLQLAFPFMSLFSRLIGMGIPIALLLVTQRRDPSMPALT